MSTVDGPVCLFCRCTELGSPDGDEPSVGAPIFCGGCGALMVLDAERDGEAWYPILRRVRAVEREELLRRPEVRKFRDAYGLDQLEARLPRSSEKSKVKEIGAGPVRIKHGDRLKMQGFGPDHPNHPDRRR